MSARPDPQRFAPTDHLSSEAVAAFADDRLPPSARDRALKHLGQCRECMEELHVQRSARYALRHSGPIRMPGSLADKLAHLAENRVAMQGGEGSDPAAEQPRPVGQGTVGASVPPSRPGLWERLRTWFSHDPTGPR